MSTVPSPICAGCYFNDEKEGCTDGRSQFDGCYTDVVKMQMRLRRESQEIAQDHFAANPRCQGVSVGGFHFTRRF